MMMKMRNVPLTTWSKLLTSAFLLRAFLVVYDYNYIAVNIKSRDESRPTLTLYTRNMNNYRRRRLVVINNHDNLQKM